MIGKIIFVIIILIWNFIGFLGMCQLDSDRINYEMIIYLILALFTPLFAKLCGLL